LSIGCWVLITENPPTNNHQQTTTNKQPPTNNHQPPTTND
jgi:hypothetical protein